MRRTSRSQSERARYLTRPVLQLPHRHPSAVGAMPRQPQQRQSRRRPTRTAEAMRVSARTGHRSPDMPHCMAWPTEASPHCRTQARPHRSAQASPYRRAEACPHRRSRRRPPEACPHQSNLRGTPTRSHKARPREIVPRRAGRVPPPCCRRARPPAGPCPPVRGCKARYACARLLVAPPARQWHLAHR